MNKKGPVRAEAYIALTGPFFLLNEKRSADPGAFRHTVIHENQLAAAGIVRTGKEHALAGDTAETCGL